MSRQDGALRVVLTGKWFDMIELESETDRAILPV